MTYAGKCLVHSEGVTLSGVLRKNEDCVPIAIRRSLLFASAEGAKSLYSNLSGKRTEFNSLKGEFRFVI